MLRGTSQARPGVIAPLTALCSVMLLGMVAFAVDTSWIVLTRSELQNAADAAALAGAQQLVHNFSAYNAPGVTATAKTALITTSMTNAKTAAKDYATYHGAGATTSLTLLDSDISIGFTNSSGTFTAYTSGGNYPNTVKVIVRRDSTANQPLAMLFARAIGTESVSLQAPASATIFTGVVNSLTNTPGKNISVLPLTYDAAHWKNFMATGQNIDGSSQSDSSGNPVLEVYPAVKDTGNFGQLSLNDSAIGTSVIRDWIQDGAPAADINALKSANLLPLSAHNPNSWDWQGSTGFTSDMVREVNDETGKTFWLPLFVAKDGSSANYQAGVGSGSNYEYNIVAFVPVKIVRAQQDHKQVWLAPSTLVDGAAVFDVGTITPAGTSSTWSATVMAPKLTN